MPLVPVRVDGRVRLRMMPGGGTDEDVQDVQDEEARIVEVMRRRTYAAGEQYNEQNWERARECGVDPSLARLPEHERQHAYSSQIGESITFIVNQIAEGFGVTVKSPSSAVDVVEAAFARSPSLAGSTDEESVVTDEALREALTAGDVAYEVRWDPVSGEAFVELWESEYVTFQNPYSDVVTRVTRREVRWVTDPRTARRREVVERRVYEVVTNAFGRDECVVRTYWDQAEVPVYPEEWLGVPFIPWGVLRACPNGLRQFRGRSVVSQQAMDAADRYDAVEQHGYKIVRYNSHGNLVVIGDAGQTQIANQQGVPKDVADTIDFPTGTTVFPLLLPSDPQMMEHQREALADQIYGSFGLTRVEPDTLQGLGGVTGYALEILNRKSDGTFRRVRRQWRKDWRALVDMVMDVVAYRQDARLVAVGPEDEEEFEVDLMDPDQVIPVDAVVSPAFWEIDPAEVFPDREVEIRMGSGYIVDDVAVRDDFTAGLVSRKEALRQRGYSDAEIEKIVEELGDESPAETAVAAIGGAEVPEVGVGANTMRSVERGGV